MGSEKRARGHEKTCALTLVQPCERHNEQIALPLNFYFPISKMKILNEVVLTSMLAFKSK